jgi:hypothetical protein
LVRKEITQIWKLMGRLLEYKRSELIVCVRRSEWNWGEGGDFSSRKSISNEKKQMKVRKGSRRFKHDACVSCCIRTVFVMLTSVVGKQFSFFSSTAYSFKRKGKEL